MRATDGWWARLVEIAKAMQREEPGLTRPEGIDRALDTPQGRSIYAAYIKEQRASGRPVNLSGKYWGK